LFFNFFSVDSRLIKNFNVKFLFTLIYSLKIQLCLPKVLFWPGEDDREGRSHEMMDLSHRLNQGQGKMENSTTTTTTLDEFMSKYERLRPKAAGGPLNGEQPVINKYIIK
jgi:hypothetical protein